MTFRSRPASGAAAVLVLAALALITSPAAGAPPTPAPTRPIDFNRDVRPILSNNCFYCHGPDPKQRKADLRLDTEEGQRADLGGTAAVVPGNATESELIRRITSTNPGRLMPPRKTGKTLSPAEIEVLTRWVKEGANYAAHWSYVKPGRPAVPGVSNPGWVNNPIDAFILNRLDAEGLRPAAAADRYTLARRVALDLTGLPPAPTWADDFVKDSAPDAYERYVDRLLSSPAYGEHWARLWLDLARYADSAGYANDPPRTIWAYRDYVIAAYNTNKPFDRFTVEQIAGDLLPNPTREQRIATAFHRNTLTNSEGGTNREEYRNVAVVDRVNTTMTVWMGTSIACSQCHDHKFDPLSQAEFFRLFAFLNNTTDNDQADEQPLLSFYSADQERKRKGLEAEIAAAEKALDTPTPALRAAQAAWEHGLPLDLPWEPLKPAAATAAAGTTLTVRPDDSVFAGPAQKDTFTVVAGLKRPVLTGLRLEALTDPSLPGNGPGRSGGNFVVTGVKAVLRPPDTGSPPKARFVRVELPGQGKILSLAEVQVFRGPENVALKGVASQSSIDYGGEARRAIDGTTDGRYEKNSVTHTAASANPWWEVDLKSEQPIDRVAVWNRTDGGVGGRLAGFSLILLDEKRQRVWERVKLRDPEPSRTLATDGDVEVTFDRATADAEQQGFPAGSVLDGSPAPRAGWAVAGHTGAAHTLTLLPAQPVAVRPGSSLVVTIEQQSPYPGHTLGRFRLGVTAEPRVEELVKLPDPVARALAVKPAARDRAAAETVRAYFTRQVTPLLKAERDRLAALNRQLSDVKPITVPVMKELPAGQRRTTRVQHRGNFLDLGAVVTPGVPAVFPPLPGGAAPDRLALANWLVSPDNPLTPRVIANRYWEQIFGTGLVRSSEEFGSQGELPSHPELLDWLATQLVRDGWDVKVFLKRLVTSAAYRQSSRVTPELFERDPDNRLLARGPRVRLSAEAVRDQALFVSGLLSRTMNGPSVKPPQPALGVNAAFGGAIDWQTSPGDGRYRRGLYTEWRRSNPYPSMSTFDAPNREVCTVRRNRTNTPLQALVTLNDTVYMEAAQHLAGRMIAAAPGPADRVRHGIRLCLARPAADDEVGRLVRLYDETRADFAKDPAKAAQVATGPDGLPPGADAVELASWTVVANVLLNLDEMFLKR